MDEDLESREILSPDSEQEAASLKSKTSVQGEAKETEDRDQSKDVVKDPTNHHYMNQDLSLSKDCLKTKDKDLKDSPDQSPSDQPSGEPSPVPSKPSVSEVLTDVDGNGKRPKTIGEERSKRKGNPVILTGRGACDKPRPLKGTIKRIEIAATLRAEGASWKEVTAVIRRRSLSTLKNLPCKYPDEWTEAYKRAIQRVMTRGHSEAFLTLRRRLEDPDGKVSVQAARGILQHIERMTTKVIKHVGKIEHEHSVKRDGLQDVVGGGLEDLREQLVG